MRSRHGVLGCAVAVCVLMVCVLPASGSPDSTAVEAVITGMHPARVATGDKVTLSGAGFAPEPWRIQVTVDGKGIPNHYFEIESSTEIRIEIMDYETSGVEKASGETERAVVIWVDGRPSNPATFIQVDWRVVAQPRVFIPLIVYAVFVLGSLVFMGGGLFQSATGNLSLSKIQMGIWLIVFSFSYVLLASIWRDFIPITPGMLWLLGISSTTAVAAKAIAVKNDPTPRPRNRASRVCSELHPTLGTYRCEIHRCQVLLWTLIVLVIYVMKMISTLHLPDIPDVLLILMGVGSGAYLGFKYPKTIAVAPPQRDVRRSDARSSDAQSSRSNQPRRRRPPRKPSTGGGDSSRPSS